MKVAILSDQAGPAQAVKRDLDVLRHLVIDVFDTPEAVQKWLRSDGGGLTIVLMDHLAADPSETLQNLKDSHGPVLAVLPPGFSISASEMLVAGASEVCRSDTHPAVLRNRVGILVDLLETRNTLAHERDNRIDHAILDPLSGCMNRRAFMDRLNAEIARVRRRGDTLCLAIMDVDHLRDVNATHGHAQGDAVLGAVGGRCRSALREMDFAGRLGGTEFALCLPEVDLNGGAPVLDRLRRGLSTLAFPSPRGPLTITVSIGLTTLAEDDEDAVGPINRADRALLSAKDKGGDRLERF